MSRNTSRLRCGSPLLLVACVLIGCSDSSDPSGPDSEGPIRVTAPLDGAVADVALVAGVPTEVVFTVQLPPDVASVAAAEIDIAATLDHVRVDGLPLRQLIWRKAGRLLGLTEDLGATAYFRIGSEPATVCAQGTIYGPFTVAHSTALNVDPPTATADDATLQIINAGAMTICMSITANFDGLLSVDGVAMDLESGACASPANFAGVWVGTYECGNFCGEPFGGSITLTVTQNGRQASYSAGGTTFSGRVCGDTFRFEYTGEDFVERGTLTLTGPDTAVKHSTWRNTFPPYCWGDCVDYLTRGAATGCPPLVIGGEPPALAEVGQWYMWSPDVSGGFGEVTVWVTTPEPIPGFSETEGGALWGTPTAEAVGTWQVNVTAYDACPTGTQVVNQMYTLTVVE